MVELSNPVPIHRKHFEFLSRINHNVQGAVGKNAFTFGSRVQNIEEIPQLLNHQLSRKDLFRYVNEPNLSNLAVTVAILAWGGMRVDNARRLFNKWDYVNPIIEKIRSGSIETRKLAYQLFFCSRAEGHLPGLGVSYYTKLICFLNHELNAFILDQWTGKSINLLWHEPFIKFDGNRVNDKNNSDTYEEFCQRIEELAGLLRVKPLDAEERLFSNGGHKTGIWREYLKDNYEQ